MSVAEIRKQTIKDAPEIIMAGITKWLGCLVIAYQVIRLLLESNRKI